MKKAVSYTAKRETCIQEIKKKLETWKTPKACFEQIISYLLENKFIDENRYAQAFIHDKIILNNWGKKKVFYALKQKGIETKVIEKNLSDFDENKYLQIIENQLIKRVEYYKKQNKTDYKNKAIAYLINKGFEQDLIYKILQKLQI